MAVIKDVAREAGLSVSAVSKYLKNPASVRKDTREKIEAAIRKLQYRPSPTARALRTGSTRMIAVVLSDLSNPFYAEFSESIRESLAQRGYNVLILSSREANDGDYYNDSLKIVDGVMFCFSKAGSMDRPAGVPSVRIGWKYYGDDPDDIAVDLVSTMKTMTEYLISQGHRRILFIGSGRDNLNSDTKLKGYLEALEAHRIPPEIVQAGEKLQDGYNAMRQLRKATDIPDAILAENDILAIGCVKYCLRHNLAVPGKVAIAGCDDITMASMYEPALTTSHMPLREMAEAAAIELISRIKGDCPPQRTVLETTLMVRTSTDPDYRQDLSQLEV